MLGLVAAHSARERRPGEVHQPCFFVSLHKQKIRRARACEAQKQSRRFRDLCENYPFSAFLLTLHSPHQATSAPSSTGFNCCPPSPFATLRRPIPSLAPSLDVVLLGRRTVPLFSHSDIALRLTPSEFTLEETSCTQPPRSMLFPIPTQTHKQSHCVRPCDQSFSAKTLSWTLRM